MSQPQTASDPASKPTESSGGEASVPEKATAPPSYVKLAMRNMVRKRGTSLYHFALSTIALLGVLVGLAYLTR
ncbi:MAG: DUF3285 domain-containing protein [Drouetiella hepatica Uher 2000/2452]|jgi:hypothetical protein|uniref:DUF3285 domain-containing protein n=1 Tax=Drouetiella hepatica Uher 2000/2452 TaxID=904376 RepID=A0A951UPM5_9CYAN|nr:DUF3285 domain-containing protein [Drouetiella hepatica Uher 2000/2452]